jgi:mono/diheme cytochrome c family protein
MDPSPLPAEVSSNFRIYELYDSPRNWRLLLVSCRLNSEFRVCSDHLVAGEAQMRNSFVILLLLASLSARAAQNDKNPPWDAPESAKQVQNPVKPTKEGLAEAAKLFRENCMTCHGELGAGDGAAAESLMRHPANFTDEKMMSQRTDGELFWKMTKGRGPMPSWEDQLSETQRWELVNYLRTLTEKAAAGKKEREEKPQ